MSFSNFKITFVLLSTLLSVSSLGKWDVSDKNRKMVQRCMRQGDVECLLLAFEFEKPSANMFGGMNPDTRIYGTEENPITGIEYAIDKAVDEDGNFSRDHLTLINLFIQQGSDFFKAFGDQRFQSCNCEDEFAHMDKSTYKFLIKLISYIEPYGANDQTEFEKREKYPIDLLTILRTVLNTPKGKVDLSNADDYDSDAFVTILAHLAKKQDYSIEDFKKVLKILKEHGYDVMYEDKNKSSLHDRFIDLVNGGNPEAVEAVLETYGIDLNKRRTKDRSLPLIQLTRYSLYKGGKGLGHQVETIKVLLEHGADPTKNEMVAYGPAGCEFAESLLGGRSSHFKERLDVIDYAIDRYGLEIHNCYLPSFIKKPSEMGFNSTEATMKEYRRRWANLK